MRIIQLCLLLSILILFIYIAIMDESHIVTMFYLSICMIAVIGLWLMRGTEEFVEYMNEQIKNRKE